MHVATGDAAHDFVSAYPARLLAPCAAKGMQHVGGKAHAAQGGETELGGHGVESFSQVGRADEPDIVGTATSAGQLAPLELSERLKKGCVDPSLLYGAMLFRRHDTLRP